MYKRATPLLNYPNTCIKLLETLKAIAQCAKTARAQVRQGVIVVVRLA